MKVLMLADVSPALLQKSSSMTLWSKHFLPTPVLNLLESLARMPDLEILVLSFSRYEEARGILWENINIEILKVPRGSALSTFYLLRWPKVLRVVQQFRPDIVHGQGIEAGYAWLATLQPFPHVLTFHGVYGVTAYLKPKGVWQRLGCILQRATLRRARNIIAISHFLKDWFCQNTSANVYYIPNAVHTSFYLVSPDAHADFDLLYVGRITPAKGLLDAIEALRILEKNCGLALRMAVIGRPGDRGGDTYMNKCRERAEILERSKVIFVGSVSNDKLPDILSRSKILVLPSYGENFSMAAAEASAAGVPVVAYCVGGLPTVVKSGETGFLVPPGDILRLAEAIEKLMTDEACRLEFGKAAKERAARWHQDVVAKETVEIYHKIVRREKDGIS